MKFSEQASFSARDKFIIGLWLRIVATAPFLLLLMPMTLLGIDFPYTKCSAAYWGLSALIIVNGIYWWLGKQREFPIVHFYFHWGIDLILISVVLYGLGGALVPSAITAYILIVITSAVFVSRHASYLVAGGASIAYVASLMAERYGVIDPRYDIAVPQFSIGMQVLVILVPIVMLALVAFIAGTLGDQLNRINALLIQRNTELSGKNAKLDKMRAELDFHSKVLTHDIRSPASAAYGALVELGRELQDRADVEDCQGLLRVAVENLDRLEDMIDALQQVQEGTESAEGDETVELQDVIDGLRIECEHQLASRGITLTVEDGLPAIRGIRRRFVVMFRNLITNAIRYVPHDGTGTITIGAIEQNGEWQIFVRDNGPGVPHEFQRVIFEMFRKAPQEAKSPGMGLGLSLVRNVAEQHHGKAWVTSDGKTGSTFWVAMPKDPTLAELASS